MSTNATVFVGLWIDWSKGKILGPTLTLHIRNGNILISIISLFIQLTGGQSWSIFCFILHQLRTTRKEQDGLYYQQQATLRNNASDAATSWKLAKIGYYWREHTLKSIQKSLWLVFIGLLHLLLFAAAGTLSSHIVTVGNEVLLATNPSCGLWNSFSIVNESQFAEAVDLTLNQRNTLAFSNQYVQNCLGGSKSSPACNTFRTPKLNWTFSTDASCPFQNGICLGPANNSLQINTAYIDSRDDLGINGDDTHRIQYRKKAMCNPLITDGYWLKGNSSRNGMSYNWEAAFYGPNNVLNSSLIYNGGIGYSDATYVRTNHRDIEFEYDETSGGSYYSVSSQVGYPLEPYFGFSPISALFNPNRSINLVFASYAGSYTGPSDDLWLSAHQSFNQSTILAGANNTALLSYYPDQNAAVLACTEQHQFCNHNPATNLSSSDKCTPFQSIDSFINADSGFVTDQLDVIMMNSYQKKVASIIQLAAWNSGFDFVIAQTDPPLMASGLCVDGASPPLPSDQWILEVTNWFSIGMVNIQRRVVDIATGPPGVDAQYTLHQASSDFAMQWYCGNQIVQRTDFTSFSVLALSLIFGFGGLVIFTSLFLEMVVSWYQLGYGKGLYQQVRWQLDSTLQLQRMAFEEARLGNWSGGAEDVPVTEKGEVFVPAREWDEWHPRIAGKTR